MDEINRFDERVPADSQASVQPTEPQPEAPAAQPEVAAAQTEAPAAPAAPTVAWKSASSRRRGGLAGYIATAVIAALVGGSVAAAAVPLYLVPQMRQQLRAVGLHPVTTVTSTGSPAMPLPTGGNELPVSQVSVVAQQVGPAIVGVVNRSYSQGFFGNQQASEAYGSGVIFDSRGYIVTNDHVIAGPRGQQLQVVLSDGRTATAKVVGADPTTDLAVLKVDAGTLPTATFGDSDKVRVGDLAVAIGDPLGLDFQRTVTAGVISGLGRNIDTSDGPGVYHDLIQTDATINPGNSGGALVSAAGQVIGINTIKVPAGLKGAEGMGFAIPSNQVRGVVDDLVKYGKVIHRAFLGVGTVGPAEAQAQGIGLQDGALIMQVQPGSPAEKAGLRKGDVILGVDGTAIHDSKSLAALMMKKQPGDRVRIEYNRNGSSETAEAVLGQPAATAQ